METTANTERHLDPKKLPISLWHRGSETLILPTILTEAYTRLIDKYGLRELSAHRNHDDPPVGGLSLESTNLHFAQAFDGSAARVQLAVLDPHDHTGSTSNTFIRCTAGNSICLTDAPCGAGAASILFLSLLAHLRAEGVLPREPLRVTLIGAEISEHARNYASELLELVSPHLAQQAIFVRHHLLHWNVTDKVSNTNLVKTCSIKSEEHQHRLLVVANFNAFLERDKKRIVAQPQLDELFRYASGQNSFAVWIEPNMNRATKPGGVFWWVYRLFSSVLKRFGKTDASSTEENPMYVSAAHFVDPLFPERRIRVGLAVMPIELSQSDG